MENKAHRQIFTNIHIILGLWILIIVYQLLLIHVNENTFCFYLSGTNKEQNLEDMSC